MQCDRLHNETTKQKSTVTPIIQKG